MKKLLWVGDAACPSGFARATHGILETLRHTYDVTALGINHRGDPHDYPYPIYTAAAGGDAFGMGRLIWMCDKVHPDVIVLQNDGWNIPAYVQHLAQFPEYATVPVVAAVAIDGKNFDGEWLKGVSLAIFWTRWAFDEARSGGYAGPAAIIPLGVDLDAYHPVDRMVARKARGIDSLGNAFIVGNVNRNQPRKRFDLAVKLFAEWVKTKNLTDVILYLHTAPTGDTGIDVVKLAKYYGILKHLVLAEPPTFYGISEVEMRDTYNCFNVCISTTQGEGMGLPAMEAMACGVPCILPDWAAYGDWARGAALLVPCSSTCIGAPFQNVIGGVVDERKFIEALDVMRCNHLLRNDMGALGLTRVREEQFRWADIGRRWAEALEGVLKPASGNEQQVDQETTEDAWTDLGRPQEVV